MKSLSEFEQRFISGDTKHRVHSLSQSESRMNVPSDGEEKFSDELPASIPRNLLDVDITSVSSDLVGIIPLSSSQAASDLKTSGQISRKFAMPS